MRKIFFTLLFLSVQTHAWDGVHRSTITTIEVTHESNYAFRVHLSSTPKMCGNTNTWAYLNKGDSNYETYVSLLTAAKFAGREVTLYTIVANGNYCKIAHAAIH